jgi:hypothetical protein
MCFVTDTCRNAPHAAHSQLGRACPVSDSVSLMSEEEAMEEGMDEAYAKELYALASGAGCAAQVSSCMTWH